MNKLLITLLALFLLAAPASAIKFITIDDGSVSDGNAVTIHDVTTPFSPSQLGGNYLHFYGAHYTNTVIATNVPTTCTFKEFNCTISTHTITITYPLSNETVPNDLNIWVNDTGKICYADNTCLDYTVGITVYNFNYRVETKTGINFWLFSPNGINILPCIITLLVIFSLWKLSQTNVSRYRLR